MSLKMLNREAILVDENIIYALKVLKHFKDTLSDLMRIPFRIILLIEEYFPAIT